MGLNICSVKIRQYVCNEQKEQQLLLGSDKDAYDQKSKEEEEHEDGFDVAEI